MHDDATATGRADGRLISGRYRLLSALGRGGMGTVWRAYDEVLQREVAVKEVRAPFDMTASQLERMNARLEREAWAAARVQHPNVVTVFDVVTEDDRPWIVMEIIHGSSMADLLEAHGPFGLRRTAHLGAEVAAALGAAHRAGVLHRDVKPANVLVSQSGRVVLSDFGIAMVEGSSSLTLTGEMVGSPEFLSPERALGQESGPASDLWALGILLYRVVEGRSPFRQDTPLMTLRAIVDEVVPPAQAAGPLAPVIDGLLRKDPGERLTADEAERALRAIGSSEDTSATGVHLTTRSSAAGSRAERTVREVGLASALKPARRPRRIVFLSVGAVVVLLAAGLTRSLWGADAEKDARPPGERKPVPAAVSVTVAGTHTAFSGDCPPDPEESPTLTATFTSTRTPMTVEYHWVAEGTPLVDSEWKTLSFKEGDHTHRVTMDFTAYQRSLPIGAQISVEIRKPKAARSNLVPVALSCRIT
ncbi:serine/threonine-protein kinase [Streptomyces sp. NPDC058108]|uniref:serine/threonine-protein kinase n=1 Tax=Streptomyces sp. NPDC058108 TaxID=3346344 RepID=UPI0036E80A9B